MYLLICIWGLTNREYAALKSTIMLLAGSGLVFVGLIMTYFTSDARMFDFFALRDHGGFSSSFQNIVYPLMFRALAHWRRSFRCTTGRPTVTLPR